MIAMFERLALFLIVFLLIMFYISLSSKPARSFAYPHFNKVFGDEKANVKHPFYYRCKHKRKR